MDVVSAPIESAKSERAPFLPDLSAMDVSASTELVLPFGDPASRPKKSAQTVARERIATFPSDITTNNISISMFVPTSGVVLANIY